MRFNLEWRIPCTIYFIRRNIKRYYDIKGESYRWIDGLPYLFGYKTGFSLSRMSTNNQISPMQFCCNTSFTLSKQSQLSIRLIR